MRRAEVVAVQVADTMSACQHVRGLMVEDVAREHHLARSLGKLRGRRRPTRRQSVCREHVTERQAVNPGCAHRRTLFLARMSSTEIVHLQVTQRETAIEELCTDERPQRGFVDVGATRAQHPCLDGAAATRSASLRGSDVFARTHATMRALESAAAAVRRPCRRPGCISPNERQRSQRRRLTRRLRRLRLPTRTVNGRSRTCTPGTRDRVPCDTVDARARHGAAGRGRE